MKNGFLLCLVALGLANPLSAGVTVQHNAVKNPEVFGLQLGLGQEFYCRVRAVNSVSMQTYLTSAYSVVEMVIDVVNSPLQVRIYSTEPLDPTMVTSTVVSPVAQEIGVGTTTALDFVQNTATGASAPVSDRVNTVIDQIPVIKDYPLTTHSKTIEYKLPTADDVVSLFSAFNSLWLREPDAIDAMKSSDAETQATGRINPLSRAVFVYSSN